MNQRDIIEISNDMHATAEAFVNQQLQILDDIHQELEHNLERPFEQDYIY